MTNKAEFQYRLVKSLKNNLSLRLLEKCKEFVYSGETLSSKKFMEDIEFKDLDPQSLLQQAGIDLFFDIGDYKELEEANKEYWNREYEKLYFFSGIVSANPLEYLNFDTLADQLIYTNWCGFSQYIKDHDTNLKTVK